MDLNKVTLIGRLSQDPEFRTLPKGTPVASFSVATGRQWTDPKGERQKQTEFHRIVAWSKLAETVSQYLHKASRVYVEGRQQTRDWVDAAGVKHYRTETVLEHLIMLGGPRPPTTPTARVAISETDAPDERAEEVVEEEVKVEAIPF